jgi:hypothetical protein
VALEAINIGMLAVQMVFRISIVVKGQLLAAPVIGGVAFLARVAEFSPVRIVGVTGNAVGLDPAENSAAQTGALRPRLVALDAFDLGMLAGQMEFRISIVVEGQFLAVPVVGRMAGSA